LIACSGLRFDDYDLAGPTRSSSCNPKLWRRGIALVSDCFGVGDLGKLADQR
jgi:hypothetical protein